MTAFTNAVRTVYLLLHPTDTTTLQFPAKDAADTDLLHTINAVAYTTDQGNTITACTIAAITTAGTDALAPTLTAAAPIIRTGGQIVDVALSGGTINSRYAIEFVFTFSDGSSLTRRVWMTVYALSLDNAAGVIVQTGPKGDTGLQGAAGASTPASNAALGTVLIPAGSNLAVDSAGTLTLAPTVSNANLSPSNVVPLFTGAGIRTLAAHFSDETNVNDFVLARDGVTDDSANFALACAAAISNNRVLHIPAGGPILLATFSMNIANLRVRGAGIRDIGAGGTGAEWGYVGSCLWLTNLSASPFLLGAGCAFEGVNFFWPNQTEAACVANGGVPIAYPPLFGQQSPVTQINRFDFIGCQVINAYDFFTAVGTSGNSVVGGAWIERNLIFALRDYITLQNVPTECFIANNDFSQASFGSGVNAGGTRNLISYTNANGTWLKVVGDGTPTSYPTTTVSGIRASRNYVYGPNKGIWLAAGCLSISDFEDTSFDSVPYAYQFDAGHAINATRFHGGTFYATDEGTMTTAQADTLVINMNTPAASSPGSNCTFDGFEVPFTFGSFATITGTGYGTINFRDIRCPVLAHGAYQTTAAGYGPYYGIQTSASNATISVDRCEFGTLNANVVVTGVQVNSGLTAAINGCRFSSVIPVDVETIATIVKIANNTSVNTPAAQAASIVGIGLTNVYDDGNVWDKPTLQYRSYWPYNYRAGAQVGVGFTGSTTAAANVGIGPAGPAALLPTNCNMLVTTLGTGHLSLFTGAFGREGLRLNDTASSVNFLSVVPAIAGAAPTLTVLGSDANAGLNLAARGTGSITISSPFLLPYGGTIQGLTLLEVGTTSGATVSQFIDSAAGSARQIVFRSGGLIRWNLATNATAEAGGNAGSDFILANYNDAGTAIGTPVTVSRATGVVALAASPTMPTPTAGDNSTKGATTAFVATAMSGIAGGVTYEGTWNATTNVPTLTSSTGTKGYYYTVATAGTTTLDGISQWNAGDHAAFNGTVWEKLDGLASEVISVAGRTGAITLAVADIAGAAPLAAPAFTGAPTAPTQTGGDSSTKLATTAFVASAVAAATTGVSSFNSRTGAVSPASGDYTVAQVTGAAPLASPGLTGAPTAPTATAGTSTTQIATTAYVVAALGGYATSGANSSITSLSGLSTPLSVAQGGSGAATLSGYVYGNGTGAMTASATIPATAIASGTLATGMAAATGTAGTGGTALATQAYADTSSANAASGKLIAANSLSDVASASTARTNLGLGSIATQAASAVAITGGTIAGTPISGSTGSFSGLTTTGLTGFLYGNGSGAVTASASIPNASVSGLGSMALQASSAVAITGGTAQGLTNVTLGSNAGTAISGFVNAAAGYGRQWVWQSAGVSRWALIGTGDAETASFTLTTSASTTASAVLNFTSTAGVAVGQSVSGSGITAGSVVLSFVANTSVTISNSVTVANGTVVTFYANAGTFMSLRAYDDGGNLLFTPITVSRAYAAAMTLTTQGYGPVVIQSSSAIAGNTRGLGAFDGQQYRTAATQVASGNYSAIFGAQNTASGAYGFAAGYSNVVSGSVGFAAGFGAADRSRYVSFAFAAGESAVVGDTQTAFGILRAASTTSAAARLTADGATAGNLNVWNLPSAAAAAYRLRIEIMGWYATGGLAVSYTATCRLKKTGTAASTTAISNTTVTADSDNDSITGLTAPTIGADTTNGGLNITSGYSTSYPMRWAARVISAVELQ